MVASRGGYRMARGRHYAKLSLSNAARLSFSDLCILLFLFLSLCRLCVCVFICSHWSLVDVPLIFFYLADHVPDWQPRVLLGMVEARSVNVKKTTTATTTTICPSDRFCRVQNLPTSSAELIWPITELYFRQILSTDFMNRFYLDVKTGPNAQFLFIFCFVVTPCLHEYPLAIFPIIYKT